MAGIDEIDDLLGDLDRELEARFQDLERQADLDEVRAKIAQMDSEAREPRRPAREPRPEGASHRPSGAPPPPPEDPLKDLKAAFQRPAAGADPEVQTPRRELLLVLCPGCGRKNRLDRQRAATADPRCGACGAALVFIG